MPSCKVIDCLEMNRGVACIFLLLLNLPPATAQTNTNITSGSSLSPLNTTSWISPSGDFAFGFQPLDSNPNLFLLAIWFARTANKTIVWSANGDKPVQAGSSVQLTAAGDLSLKDDAGSEVWKAGVSEASHAALLDTGNLVIAGASGGSSLWESFNTPTDTILPSQKLGLGSQLRSRLTNTNYTAGRFLLSVQTDGNLVFYPLAIPTGNQYEPASSSSYFSSNTAGNGSSLVFDNSGSVYLSLKSGSTFNLTSPSSNSYKGSYQRASLDPDGVFRHYIYPKNISNSGWSVTKVIPPDICQALDTAFGSGACGFNSYCKSGGGDNLNTDCECLPNYSFLDPRNKYRGCAPDFTPQSCTEDESALFDMVTVRTLNWPGDDMEMNSPVEEATCRDECLQDCFCALAIYGDEGRCWKKKFPLSNGKLGSYNQGVTALSKVRRANSTYPPPPPPPSAVEIKKASSVPGSTWIAAGSSLLGTSVLVNFITILLLTRKKQRIRLEAKGMGLSLRRFTYEELEEATNGFRDELGRGAFGRVYKGQLQEADPIIPVAIKRLDKLLPDTEKEFDNEIKSIGQTHHRNLVRLLGFCSEGTERILVYEHMSNGDLTSFLFGERPGWNQRVNIATGIARGLLYLHEECANQIIHCDIKPQNVLLDDNFTPRISDFGLAKLLGTEQTRTVTGIRGTRGYVAPEWFKAVGGVTAKVDVYSFGVMLLEIVTCRRNVVVGLVEEEEILTFWAYDCHRDGRVGRLIQGDKEAEIDIKRVEMFLAVAIWCIQEEPALRPSMRMVSQMLDGAVAIPVPPDPSIHWASSMS